MINNLAEQTAFQPAYLYRLPGISHKRPLYIGLSLKEYEFLEVLFKRPDGTIRPKKPQKAAVEQLYTALELKAPGLVHRTEPGQAEFYVKSESLQAWQLLDSSAFTRTLLEGLRASGWLA